MNHQSVTKARILLIRLGKLSPFLVCFLVLISYIENLYALIFDEYILFDNALVLYKPISNFIGDYFEYNLITVILLIVISIAVETCIWNKLCIAYLAIQLYEKHFFVSVELYKETILLIVCANIAVIVVLLYNGIKQICKTQ